MICAFCPARACEGLTAIPACETHWDNPERAATELEVEAREQRARADAAEIALAALLEAMTELLASIDAQGEYQSGLTQAQYDRQVAALARLRALAAGPAAGDGAGGEG